MADTNITWNETPIDDIERDSLSLSRINENGTIREMVDTINANFLNIAKHGGGPAGMDGSNGSNGADGANVEYIYALCDEMNPDVQYPTDRNQIKILFDSVKSSGSHPYKGVTWFDNARPISPDYKNEYVWSRIKRGTGLSDWYYASEPVLWSHWGETGQDGDGVEYIFLASSNELTNIALNTSLLKIKNMDDYQKAIFNIDDFYPGKEWFKSGINKQKARLAISKKGLVISDSEFDKRWGEYFKFCNDTYSWTDEPTGTRPSVLYEYVSIRKSTTDKNDIKTWGDFSTPALWSNYNLPTKTAIIYCNLKEDITPEPPKGGWFDISKDKLVTDKVGYKLTPDYWKDTNEDAEENQITWMCTGVFDHTGENAYWSSPVRITGSNGKNGEDGTLIEFIYALTTYGKQPDYPNIIINKEKLDKLFNDIENSTTSPKYSTYGSTKWYDRAQPISIENPVEYMAQRSKKPDEKEWTYTEPIIWSHWGEDGTDGDGVEYIFATTKTDSNSSLVLPVYSSLNDSQKKIFQIDDFVPSKKWFDKPKSKDKAQEILGESFNETEWNSQYGFIVSSGWSDNPVEVGPSVPYQWVSIRRSYADEHNGNRFWEDFSTPVLWNSYGKRTRTFIVYCNMSDETIPESPRLGWWNTSNDTLQISKTDSGEYKSNALSSGTPDYTSYIGYWSDNNIDVRGTITWISTGEFNDSIDENGSNNISWSKPFRITGETGEPGADGSNREFVYALCDDKDSLKYPQNGTIDEKNTFFETVESKGAEGYDYEGTIWYDNSQGVSNENGKRTEWVWSRSKPAGDLETTQWETAPSAVIWSHWGEDGTDGDGVEYIFARSTQKPLDDIDKPYKVSELNDVQKVIYNINDFFPGDGWFTLDNKEITKQVLKDAGITLSESEFDTQWNNRFNIIKTSSNSGDIVCDWWDNPRGVDLEHPFEFVSIRKSSINDEGKKIWGDFSDPALWSEYPIKSRTFIVYCNVDEGITPDKPRERDFTWNVQNDSLVKNDSKSIWSDTNIDVPGQIAWLCSGLFAENGNVISWSAPFRITGKQGEKGADGSTIEFVYALSDTIPNFPGEESYEQKCSFFESVESAGINGHEYVGTTWYDNPQGITNEDGQRKEWVWSRNKSVGSSSTEWTFPEKPVIWSHWGEDGTDGDGVEYMFLLENFDTYNLSTEEGWNTFFSSNFTGNNVSDTAKYVYATSDFLPTLDWFNESNSSAIQTRMEADGKTFDATVWNNLKTEIDSIQLGTWKDNPGSVNVSNKYQYVSIRKMSNGVWGAFSYPKLWSKYAIVKFKSIAFTATTIDTDLSGCIVTGGNFSNPLPDLTKKGEQTIDVKWTDGPEPDESTGKIQIWMTSANVSEDNTSALVWSTPQKMTDTSDFQVEWSSTDKSLTELASINQSLTQSKYNFGTFLNANNYNENVAELAWRTAMSDDFGISFGDNSENAILMATCQLKNGVWSDWKITRVKGEKGDAGTSVNIKGKIVYESYLTSGTEYNYENANNGRSTYTPDKTPENGDLLIVYPAEPNESGIYYGNASDGGKLYMWKYTNNKWIDYNNPNSIGEETGNTYVSPNGHLILWDGDSWQDLGNIVGPEGKSYTIAVKYAKDGKNGDKEVITNELEIPNAKWIGICVYEEGTTIPDIKDPSWKWSLFKGQDGYGYEYIFKATSTKDSASIPQVPQMPSGGNWHTTPNIIPGGWTDEPIEPSEKDRYIWMCWRKFDHEKQQWTDFMGVENTTNAKLWHFYVTDGKPGEPGAPGEAGNGYQYKYIRYDNSVNYGSTTCTVTNPSSDRPVFKIGAVVVSSTDSAQGADSGHTYEYRSERYGHTGSWSNWSNPVIIAKYLDDSDIQATVQREVSTATSGIKDSIKSSFQETINDVNSLKEHIDPKTGVFSGTISDDTKTSLLSGYINTDNLTDEIKNVKLSGFDVDSNTNTARTFSEWIDYENNQYTTVNTKYDSLNGRLTTAVNDISKKASSSALTEYQTKADAQFAKLENTVANGQYITDVDGYLLIKEADGSKRQALDKNGNPTKNYIDVRESDRNKLIFITTELASISQTVSDGIACTSIVTSTENGAAIFYQQVDDNGSNIYMDANTIGIHSDYFNLNSSGLEMTGNLLAKDKNGNITAGVIGDDTTGNDIKFFAGPKQKLICVKDTTNTNNLSQIFVRYPSLDKKSNSHNLFEEWKVSEYDYNVGGYGYKYYDTFVYDGSTYYMWKCLNNTKIAILTKKPDYLFDNLRYYHNNLRYYDGILSLTPKIVAILQNEMDYDGEDPNFIYIIDQIDDIIYIDHIYDFHAWVLGSNSEGVSLADYYNSLNSLNEQLDTNTVIYTASEDVMTNDTLEITGTLSYKVMDVLSLSLSDAIKQSSFKVYEDGSIEATKGKFGCLEIGVEEWSNTKASILKGTIYENSSYLTPDEISGLEPDQYNTHYMEISPEIFEINAHRGEKYESVRILPLGDSDRWEQVGLVDITTRSDESIAIYAEGKIVSDHFISYKKIATSTSDNYQHAVEAVTSNLSGLNIAFIVSDKNLFEFKFTENDARIVNIYLNGLKILSYWESESLTTDEKNSISVDNNISNSNGIWRYKTVHYNIASGGYVNLVGCYTTAFNKALQPSTLFIQLGANGNNGSIYLGNIKIVG